MKIRPFIVGSGSAASAMQKALFSMGLHHPDWSISSVVKVPRGETLNPKVDKDEIPLLLLANPHGLHATYLKEAAARGFRYVLCEKPVCINLEEVATLKALSSDLTVAVCHGYRMMWGPRELKRLIDSGEMGKIITIEGRYWQSSSAQKALSGGGPTTNWKNDPKLAGNYDVLTDLGSHWADLMFFLAGEPCESASGWQSHINAEKAHRDTHLLLTLDFKKTGRTFGSVSKTVHGKGNHLEINIIGEKLSATWNFQNPDTLTIGHGDETNARSRKKTDTIGSGQSPFHGLGWLEGYCEITHQLLKRMNGETTTTFPTLAQALAVMETLLKLKVV